MKKLLFVVFSYLLFTFFLLSCTEDSASNVSDTEVIMLSNLEETFDSINKELVTSLGLTRGGTNPGNGGQVTELKDTIRIILKDAKGALEGASAGITLGGGCGTVTIPVIGTVSGATLGGFIGGIIGAVAESWDAWYDNTSSFPFPSGVIYLHQRHSQLNYCNLLDNLNHVFADKSDSIGMDSGIGPTSASMSLKIASLHNLMLDEMRLSPRPVASTDSIINAPASFFRTRYEIMKPYNTDSVTYASEISKASRLVFIKFGNAFSSVVSSRQSAHHVIDRYMEEVSNNSSISEDDKHTLLIMLGVAWYSYNYWNNYEEE